MGVWYTTREDVMSALDFKETSRDYTQIDRAIETASRAVESLCHRVFYPTLTTRYKDWPNVSGGNSYRLWLDTDEVISLSELASGGVVITTDNYLLRPADGPPYTYIELDRAGSGTFGNSASGQDDISMTGVFGYRIAESAVATSSASVDSTQTSLVVSNSAAVGVGQLLRIDSERMTVAGKSQALTGATLTGTVTAQLNTTSIPITGAAVYAGEVILVGSEKMKVLDVAGSNLIVKRAWDGSVLAAHSAADVVYAPRDLTVVRAGLGTTGAAHNSASTVYRFDFPSLVISYTLALAITQIQNEQAGMARTVGSGDNQREASGRGLAIIREDCYAAHGRKARMRAV